jgi:hypothetical protein
MAGVGFAPMPLPPLLTIEIPRVNGGVVEVIDAASMAEVFFATEISSLGEGSYDARTLTTDPNRVDREDIRVLNASFRAMIMKMQLWEPLFAAGDLPWLVALDRNWDLVTMSENEWAQRNVADLVEAAVAEVVSVKGRGIAQATKLLHLKRPALVPVIDSFVARALGAKLNGEASAAVRVRQTRVILEHFRAIGVALRPQLERVDAQLRVVGIARSLTRILDCLIWCSEADTWVALAQVLERWRANEANDRPRSG